ncbi:MAG: mechanosensitive ion channel domain-containing protein [Pseudomonadota bacterium]
MLSLLRFLTVCCFVCVLLPVAGEHVATAQDAAPTLEAIERQLEAVNAREDLEDDARSRAIAALENARALIRAAADRRQTVQRYVEEAETSAQTREVLEAELRALQADDTLPDLPDTSEGLRSRLNFLTSERSLLQQQRDELLGQQSQLESRSGQIAEEIAIARATLSGLEARTGDGGGEESSTVAEAQETLRQARIFNQRTTLETLQRELQTIPQRQPILSARLALIDTQIARLERELNAIQQRLSDVRMDLADTALARSQELETAATDLPPAAQEFADVNIAYANRLRTMAERALSNDLAITKYGEQVAQIRRQAATVNRVVETGRISGDVGALLRQVRGTLPNVSSLRDAAVDIDYERVSLQLDLVLWQDELRSASLSSDPAGWISDSVDLPMPQGPFEAEALAVLEALLDQRIVLLDDLVEAGDANADRLTALELAVLETLEEAQELGNTLDRRLFWLPSTTRPLRDLPSNLVNSMGWLAAPTQVTSIGEGFVSANETRWLPLVLCALAAAFIMLARPTLRSSFETLNAAVGRVAKDRYWTTPLAVFNGALLAAPIALLLAAFALSPALYGDAETLSTALARGVCSAAAFLYLIFLIATLRREGVLNNHFAWSDKACKALGKAPRWFLALTLLTVFASIVAAASGRQDFIQGLGMLSFMAASICFSVLGFFVFRLENGWITLIVARGVSATIQFIGLLSFVLAPLVIGVLPLFGYVETAFALQARLVLTAGALLLIALAYGILNRQLLIAQRRLVLRKALQRRAEADAARSEDDEDEGDNGGAPKSSPEQVAEEEQRISTQARRVLVYACGIAALTVILTIWATILPALGIANEVVLWTGVEVVDGERIQRPVTLWNLILFFALIGAGSAAAYNVRGLLELGLFQRLNISAGSRYAVVTIISYLLFGTGLVAGFLQLGLDWSRLQWIIAALGVGLGFGLQEIVANFISGVIILFERPVRVGDFVTIGELEGTVSNIAIRATTITDFDNREVLLPNKSIITENVTNWTLRDSIMRIIVPIGVAYGSDVDRVRELLMSVADENTDVMETPAPRVFFMEHGDSSLNFEVRAFISNPRKRFRVRDELNAAINKALAVEGIEIPFPQRDLHVRSAAEGLLGHVKTKGQGEA